MSGIAAYYDFVRRLHVTEDYVNMPIPKSRVQEVYDLLGGAEHEQELSREYDEMLMFQLWREASTEVRKVLQHLSLHPGERVPAADLVEVASVGTGRALGGVFARFRERCVKRYKRDLPWETITLGDVNYYVMSADNAKHIEPLW